MSGGLQVIKRNHLGSALAPLVPKSRGSAEGQAAPTRTGAWLEVEQLRAWNLKGFGELIERVDLGGWRILEALKSLNMTIGKVGFFGQLFLRPTFPFPKLPQVPRKL